jgi:hypothetical protein
LRAVKANWCDRLFYPKTTSCSFELQVLASDRAFNCSDRLNKQTETESMKNYYDPPRRDELCEFSVYDDDNCDFEVWNEDDFKHTINDKDRERYKFELDPRTVKDCEQVFTQLRHFAIRNGLKSGTKSQEFLEQFFNLNAERLYAAHIVDASAFAGVHDSVEKVVSVLKLDIIDFAKAKKLINSKLKS